MVLVKNISVVMFINSNSVCFIVGYAMHQACQKSHASCHKTSLSTMVSGVIIRILGSSSEQNVFKYEQKIT